jgi:hypothetical protein
VTTVVRARELWRQCRQQADDVTRAGDCRHHRDSGRPSPPAVFIVVRTTAVIRARAQRELSYDGDSDVVARMAGGGRCDESRQ